MNNSVIINNWSDLKAFGINSLTGEACAFSLRVLCDVNAAGLENLREFFGLLELGVAPQMNSQVNEEPSVGSLMLPRGIFKDLCTFLLWSDGALAVYETSSGGYQGVYSADYVEKYSKIEGISLWRNPRPTSTSPHVGSRNIHAATGRIM
ncbi:hypothetical protein LC612_38820 [Nostoc sp. CHAB 5834]|nr:hypothetical protein [Nostoc sp. CHAB 5834]